MEISYSQILQLTRPKPKSPAQAGLGSITSLADLQKWAQSIIQDAEGDLLKLAQRILQSKDQNPEQISQFIQSALQYTQFNGDGSSPRLNAPSQIAILNPMEPQQIIREIQVQIQKAQDQGQTLKIPVEILHKVWNQIQLDQNSSLDSRAQLREVTPILSQLTNNAPDPIETKKHSEYQDLKAQLVSLWTRHSSQSGQLFGLNEYQQPHTSLSPVSSSSPEPTPKAPESWLALRLILEDESRQLSPTIQALAPDGNWQNLNRSFLASLDVQSLLGNTQTLQNDSRTQRVPHAEVLPSQTQFTDLTLQPNSSELGVDLKSPKLNLNDPLETPILADLHQVGISKSTLPAQQNPNLEQTENQDLIPIIKWLQTKDSPQIFQKTEIEHQICLIPLEAPLPPNLSQDEVQWILNKQILPTPQIQDLLQGLQHLGIHMKSLSPQTQSELLALFQPLEAQHSSTQEWAMERFFLQDPERPESLEVQVQNAIDLSQVESGHKNWKSLIPLHAQDIEKEFIKQCSPDKPIMEIHEFKEFVREMQKHASESLRQELKQFEQKLEHLEMREMAPHKQILFVHQGEILNAQIQWNQDQNSSASKGKNKGGPSFQLQTSTPSLGPIALRFNTEEIKADLHIRENQGLGSAYQSKALELQTSLREIGLELRNLIIHSPEIKKSPSTSPSGVDLRA